MSDESDSTVARELAEVVRGLVDEPDEVFVEEEDQGDTVVLTIHSDEDEVGKIIGRQGRTVRALRALLEARGATDDVYYDVEVAE